MVWVVFFHLIPMLSALHKRVTRHLEEKKAFRLSSSRECQKLMRMPEMWWTNLALRKDSAFTYSAPNISKLWRKGGRNFRHSIAFLFANTMRCHSSLSLS